MGGVGGGMGLGVGGGVWWGGGGYQTRGTKEEKNEYEWRDKTLEQKK